MQYGYEIIAPNEGPKEILAIDFSDYYDACPGPIYLSSTAANTDGKFHVSWTGNVIDFEVIVSDPSISKTITSTNQEIFDIKKGATIDLIVFWEEDITIEIRDSGPTGEIIDIIIVDSRNAPPFGICPTF